MTSDLVARARDYAVNAHRRIDHRRKYNKQPYAVHLKAVAELVASVTDDEEMIAAAWLHDTVEDTPATFGDIETAFGPAVSRLVRELTDVSKPGDGNRAVRKGIDRAHLAGASSRAKTIKLADLIDNCRDICGHDRRFARVYVGEARALAAVLGEGEARLRQRLDRELSRCAKDLGLSVIGDETASLPDSAAMQAVHAQPHRWSRLFMEAFTAKDIAEPLPSFDASADVGDLADWLATRHLKVAGIRSDGLVTGYVRFIDVEKTDAEESGAGFPVRAFNRSQLVSADASLTDVIQVLTRHDYCFVTLFGSADGVISRTDIQKPVVRMWLFGMITMIEMELANRIRSVWPDGIWVDQLSEGRLRKAETLLEERRRRGQVCDLVDCLQLSDKTRVLVRDDAQLEEFGFTSRAAAKQVSKELESLRNNLAHAQDIVTHDWPQIVRMTRRIERIMAPPG